MVVALLDSHLLHVKIDWDAILKKLVVSASRMLHVIMQVRFEKEMGLGN